MRRLKTLLASYNQISAVDSEVADKLIALETLVLNNNKVSEFEELDGLVGCKGLRYLSLLDNPITKKPHYRLTIVAKLPQLKCLDFRKISQAEHQAAQDLVAGSSGQKHVIATKGGRGRKAKDVKDETLAPQTKRQKLNVKEMAKIREQINTADSIEEISRLEKILETGYNL